MTDDSVNRGENAKGKPRGRPFEKGNTLGGRKAIPPEIKAAYEETSPEALETLKSVMRAWRETQDPKLAGAAVASANSVLDRAHGRAPAAPEDNEALRDARPLAGKTAAEILAAMRGEG